MALSIIPANEAEHSTLLASDADVIKAEMAKEEEGLRMFIHKDPEVSAITPDTLSNPDIPKPPTLL